FSFTALVYKKFGEVQVIFLSRYAIKFHQTHFNDFVTWSHVHFIGPKYAHQQIGILQCDVKEIALSCCHVVSIGSLIHMSCIVKLMAVYVFQYPALVARPGMRMGRIDGTRSV